MLYEVSEQPQRTTSAPDSVHAASHAQLRRMLKSASFRDAHIASRLLEYIVTNSMNGQEDRLNEFSIGMDVLGRKADFDPQTDTIVRVQAHRLRGRIKRYYEAEGNEDPILISIPRGCYSAEIVSRQEHEVVEVSEPLAESLQPESQTELPVRSIPRAPWRLALITGIALIAGLLGGYWIANLERAHREQNSVTALWSAMLKGDQAPIIGYPDAIFLLDNSGDMFPFSEGAVSARGGLVEPHIATQYAWNPDLVAHAGPLYYENSYTGTGELEGVATLYALLKDMGFSPQIKRGHDITANDLRTHNVILLGGSVQNKAAQEFLPSADFEYSYKHQQWGGSITNRHPRPGEASSYQTERNPVTQVLQADYALISCQPTADSSHRIIELGGLDTIGTFGATQYVTSNAGAETLSRALNDHQDPFFQALVHVTIANGDAVLGSEAIAIHVRQQTKNSVPGTSAKSNWERDKEM